MISKINRLNVGVFKDFKWEESLENDDQFKRNNIIYGRNYSGKTTLSRIFHSLNTKKLPPKYEPFEFSLKGRGRDYTQSNLDKFIGEVHVYNQDFVQENLEALLVDNGDIQSFRLALGEGISEIREEINYKRTQLGADKEGEETGLYRDFRQEREDQQRLIEEYESFKKVLETSLTDKARTIRENSSLYGDVNYNKGHLSRDIEVLKDGLGKEKLLSENQLTEKKKLLEEKVKKQISFIESPPLNFVSLSSRTKALVEKRIQVGVEIDEELKRNPKLFRWIAQGWDLHKDGRENCAFCKNEFTEELRQYFSGLFNREAENLKGELQSLSEDLKQELNREFLLPDSQDFYINYEQTVIEVVRSLKQVIESYRTKIKELLKQVLNRLENLHTPMPFSEVSFEDVQLSLESDYQALGNLIEASNSYAEELEENQNKIRKELLNNEVRKYIKESNYLSGQLKLQEQDNALKISQERLKNIEENIEKIKREIAGLEARISSEHAAKDRINEMLDHHFGHKNLRLESLSKDREQKYVFEVHRDGKRAYNLSEGEKSLIAFCYFIAKVSESNEAIIWLDDPISSLDSNHLFFIYSLIRAELIDNEKLNYKQLFISTHSLPFLKYLNSIKNTGKFLIERRGEKSIIRKMPRFMTKYVTEFFYLFEQIYLCAHEEIRDDNHYLFYNFGNNARRFLEMFLAYKYPDKEEEGQYKAFFGDKSGTIGAILHDRLHNEKSHLKGVFEGALQVPVFAEIQVAANSILEAMKQKNEEQYLSYKNEVMTK